MRVDVTDLKLGDFSDQKCLTGIKTVRAYILALFFRLVRMSANRLLAASSPQLL